MISLILNGVLENIVVCVKIASKKAIGRSTLCLWLIMQLFLFFGHFPFFMPELCSGGFKALFTAGLSYIWFHSQKISLGQKHDRD